MDVGGKPCMVGMATGSEQVSELLILHFHVYHVVHDCFGWLVSVMIRGVGGKKQSDLLFVDATAL